MTLWHAIVLAAIIVAATKLAGFVVPARLLEGARTRRILELATVSLLAGLVVVQTLGQGQGIAIDARVPAVLLAAGLLAARAPFLVVVIAAAALAAVLRRFAGWA